jgi:hypothetical protein
MRALQLSQDGRKHVVNQVSDDIFDLIKGRADFNSMQLVELNHRVREEVDNLSEERLIEFYERTKMVRDIGMKDAVIQMKGSLMHMQIVVHDLAA